MRLLYKLLFIIFVPVLFLFALSSFGTPLLQATTASGSLIFNEIMYNPNGNDTGREWIELYNNSSSPVNLNDWKFSHQLLNGNTNAVNHMLTFREGVVIINPGSYAVLTGSGSVETFHALYPTFAGTIYTYAASVSLPNSPTQLVLKDNINSTEDMVDYPPLRSNTNSYLAYENGRTLSKNIDGVWLEGEATPGVFNIFPSPTNSNANSANENVNINTNADEENNNLNQNSACHALPGDVVINELLVAPSSNTNNHEWIELYNKKDCTLDLSDWTIDDASSSPKTLSGSIMPGEYVLLEPSPISLNNTGDQVILKEGDIVIDEMCYGNTNGCLSPALLPTYNQSLGRFPNGKDTDQGSDFKVFGTPTKGSENIVNNHAPIAVLDLQYPYKTVGNAPFSVNATGERSYDVDHDSLIFSWDFGDGFKTSEKNPLAHKYYTSGSFKISLTVSDPWDENNTASIYITVLPATTGSSGSTSPLPSCTTKEGSQGIELSEFLPNPAGPDSENEFIEIVNHDTKPVNLCGWQLDDKEGGSKPYTLGNIIIQQEQYVVLYSKETKLALNNDEDDVRLMDPWGKIIEQIHYTNPPENKSYAKIKQTATAYRKPKLLASTDLSIGMTDPPTVWAWMPPSPEQPNDTPVVFKGVVINEVLPNPIGLDTEGEFIELRNTTENPIDLQGWQLSDASGTTYTFKDPMNINANGVLAIPYNQSNITLNNDTDTIQLLDSKSGLQDKVSYTDGVEGKSYSRFINNISYPQDSTWEWVAPTPNAENEREKLDVQAEPAGGIYNGPVSVSLRANQPNTKIFYSFSGDATPDEQYEYIKPIVLRSSSEVWFFGFIDEQNATLIKTEKYSIKGASLTATGSVIISESYPDPEKADSGKEWIELHNGSNVPVDISAWYITNKLHQKISVPDHTILAPSAYYVLTWHDVAFHLVNTSDILSLYNTNGIGQDEMRYNHVQTKQSIVRVEQNGLIYNISTPSDFPTPGGNNIDQKAVLQKIKKTVSRRKSSTYHPLSGSSPSSIAENMNTNENNINDNSNHSEEKGDSPLSQIKNTGRADITRSMNTPYTTYLLLGMAIFVIVLATILFFYRKKL